MRLLIENNAGSLEQLGELTDISDASQLLIFKLNRYIKKENADALENDLSKKTGKTCIILGPEFERVMGTN